MLNINFLFRLKYQNFNSNESPVLIFAGDLENKTAQKNRKGAVQGKNCGNKRLIAVRMKDF